MENAIKEFKQKLLRKEQECEKVKQNAQDTYDLWQALIDSFNILQGDKIKLEQECERLEEANNTLTVTREKLLGDLCIVEESLKDYTEHYNRQSEELDQLKVERDKIKAIGNNYFDEYEMCCLDLPDAIGSLLKRYDSVFAIFKKERKEFKEECDKFKQTLTEIKPTLELYASSKIGEEQLDGTYKITVKNSSVLGDTYITFDPRPAKQALQKISKCEV